MEIELLENLRSEESVTQASDPPLHEHDDHPSPSTDPPLVEKDDHPAKTGPQVEKWNDHPPSKDPPTDEKDDHPVMTGPQVEKRIDHPPSTDPPTDEKDDHPVMTGPQVVKRIDHPPSADPPTDKKDDHPEIKDETTILPKAKQIKQEPNIKMKEEPIDLEDDYGIHSHKIDDDDDDDDIIVLDVTPGNKKGKNKSKTASDEKDILIIIDDDDDEEDVDPSTTSQTPKERVGTEPIVDPSVSDDIQVDQVKTATEIGASHSIVEPSDEGVDPNAKSICEVAKELTNPCPPTPSTTPSSAVGSTVEANTDIEVASETVLPTSPESLDDSEKGSEDATTNQLALKDTLSVPEPLDKDESTEPTNFIAEEDDARPELEDGDQQFGDGYDSDGWAVASDVDPDEAAETGENSGKGMETEQSMDEYDTNLKTRQEALNTIPRPIQIIPVDSDQTTRQDDSPVPVGIIPIASEMSTGSGDVTAVTGTGESGQQALVSPVTKENVASMDQNGLDSDQDDGDSPAAKHGLRSQCKPTEESRRGAVTRSKLRSCSKLLKGGNKNAIPSGKPVERKLRGVVKGELPPDNPVFNCHLCFHSFGEKKLLEKHLVNHPKVTRIMCEYCNTSFDKQRNLTMHLKRCFRRRNRKSPRKTLNGETSRVKKEENADSPRRSAVQAPSLKRGLRKLGFLSARKDGPCTKAERTNNESHVIHECKICERVFPSFRGLSMHRKLIHVRGDKRDKSSTSLKRGHGKLGFPSVKKEWPCTKAERTNNESHVIHECKICERVFPSFRGLSMHHKKKHAQGNKREKNPNLQELENLNRRREKDVNRKRGKKFGVWLCPKCHASFTSRKKVKRHMYLTHSETYTKNALRELEAVPKEEAVRIIYYCSTCIESFRSEHFFDCHEPTRNSRKRCEKLFQCNLCFKHFKKKAECARHVQEHLGSVESGKRKRKRRSSSPDEQQSSRKRAKVIDGFKCKYCNETFQFEYRCAKHEFTHTDRDPWHCYICFKIFYLKSSIVAHMERAHKEASYCKKCYCIIASKNKKRCIDCDKRRRAGSGLKCSICKTEFASASDLTCHILTHVESGVETPVIRAPKASRVLLDSKFKNVPLTSVVKHPPSKILKTSKKVACSVGRPVTISCPESLLPEAPPTTKTVSLAAEHTTSDKYDVCMKCGEQDIPAKELSRHARTHLDVRSRFQCNTCQQCFATMYEIEEHGCVPTHQASCSYTVSNVVYQCQFCGRDFPTMMEARKHVLSTNTSCLLECTVCKAEYSRQGDLMVHMVIVHGQYLECDKCSAQFTKQVDLDFHIRQHEDMSH
ncbi:zinc finger protein Xfin isoform X2 [Strongylocentrotus purpuratus]|uniref:C2H2-type domain-containing protein n=1 Tax=Strongylocentrotus purpuratus TaxID=7668 RepID=A0A7M7HFG9_STRPU|nr:zinc finger protein Xfin isoform X2 [Strongylocentrotus purpuratus]